MNSFPSFSLAQAPHLRNDPSEFTAEEWEALSHLTLPDPDPVLVKELLKEKGLLSESSSPHATSDESNCSSEIERKKNENVGCHPTGSSSALVEQKDACATEDENNKKHEAHSRPNSNATPIIPRPPKQWSSHQTEPRAGVILRDFMSSSVRPFFQHEAGASGPTLLLSRSNSTSEVGIDSCDHVSLLASSNPKGVERSKNALSQSSVALNKEFNSFFSVPSSIFVDTMKESLSIMPKMNRKGDTDAIAETILEMHHVELIDRGLHITSSAEVFLNATHIFLQYNLIEELDGLQLLDHLQVLVVHHNRIRSIQPLGVLSHLTYLDASYNSIEHVNMDWDLPDTLQVLDLRHNPCCPETNSKNSEYEKKSYRERAVLKFPSLVELDGRKANGEDEEEEEERMVAEVEETTGENTRKGERAEEHLNRPDGLSLETQEKVAEETAQNSYFGPESLRGACHLIALTDGSASSSQSPVNGLVSTLKRGRDKKLSPSVSCAGRSKRLVVPSQQRAGSTSSSSTEALKPMHKQCASKRKGDSQKKILQLSDGGGSGFVEKRRKNIVEEIRAARGVKFDLPEATDEDNEDTSAERGRNPGDDPLAYPSYDVALLQSSTSREVSLEPSALAPNNDGSIIGKTPLEAMLHQYMRRSAALIQVIREEALTAPQSVPAVGSHGEEEQAEQKNDEVRLARQVRNRARSDLDYASTVLGHHSKRSVEQLWSDVDKVLQTRSALVELRRSRMEELTTQHSAAYLESLALLKKEQHVKDLEKYRNPK